LEMFTEKPLVGWHDEAVLQAELERRASDFHPEYYVFHNTYLEIAVKFGLVGLAVYAWLVGCLFRLAKNSRQLADSPEGSLVSGLRKIWPLIVVVYLLNASAVVMNYQFVNGLLFTFAGILVAQDHAELSAGS